MILNCFDYLLIKNQSPKVQIRISPTRTMVYSCLSFCLRPSSIRPSLRNEIDSCRSTNQLERAERDSRDFKIFHKCMGEPAAVCTYTHQRAHRESRTRGRKREQQRRRSSDGGGVQPTASSILDGDVDEQPCGPGKSGRRRQAKSFLLAPRSRCRPLSLSLSFSQPFQSVLFLHTDGRG